MDFKKLAGIISIVFGPQVWLPVIIIATLFKSQLSMQQLFILFPGLFIFQVFIPLGYVYIARYFGKVTAWDLPKREERYQFLVITFFSYAFSMILIYLFGNQFLFYLNLILLLLLIIIFITTYFWKISIHASVNTVGAILLNFLFDWKLYPLYLAIPLVGWARLELKRHSLSQLVAGVFVSGIMVLGAFYYLGYFTN